MIMDWVIGRKLYLFLDLYFNSINYLFFVYVIFYFGMIIYIGGSVDVFGSIDKLVSEILILFRESVNFVL